jgi:hypothetical protein
MLNVGDRWGWVNSATARPWKDIPNLYVRRLDRPQFRSEQVWRTENISLK